MHYVRTKMVNPSIVGHYTTYQTIMTIKFSCEKNMHWKILRKIPVEPHTFGYICKKLQIICCDYDACMADSKLVQQQEFSLILKGFKKLCQLKNFCACNV